MVYLSSKEIKILLTNQLLKYSSIVTECKYETWRPRFEEG